MAHFIIDQETKTKTYDPKYKDKAYMENMVANKASVSDIANDNNISRKLAQIWLDKHGLSIDV